MPPESPSSPPQQQLDLFVLLGQHPTAAIVVGAVCLWVSVSLILRMWLIYPRESFAKKLLWSVALMIPLFGWLFYAGCFRIPDRTDSPCAESAGGQV